MLVKVKLSGFQDVKFMAIKERRKPEPDGKNPLFSAAGLCLRSEAFLSLSWQYNHDY